MAPSHLMDKNVRESSSFLHKYCRMCALEIKQGVFIFGEEGKRLHIPEKIRRTLAILVLEEDTLPKKICTDCCSSLEDYAQYKNTVLDAQEKLACIAKSLMKSECRQRLHKAESASTNYEESVISSSESLSDEDNDNSYKRTQEVEKRNKEIPKRKCIKIPVKCGICAEIFTEENKMTSHYGEKHNSLKHQSPIMQCSSCSKISLNYRDISRHYLRHHKNDFKDFKVNTYYSCKQCGKRYHSHSELMIHVKAKHRNSVELPNSPTSSISLSSVVSTQDVPEDDDFPPEAPSTGSPASEESPSFSGHSSFNNAGGSIANSNVLNTPPKYSSTETTEPVRETVQKDSLQLRRQHKRVVTEIEQPVVNVGSSSTSYNDYSTTRDENDSSKAKKDKITRKCDICDKVLTSRAGYANHMMVHEGRRFDCKECGVSYTQKTALDTHIKVHHANVPKNLSCSVCDKKFMDVKSLNRHQKIHSEPSLEFQCSFCQKTYTTDAYLQRHVSRHTNPPRHLCPTCGKGFYQKRKLDEHIHTHTGEKTEGCPFCNKYFGSYSNYVKHVQKQHASELGDGKKVPPPKKVLREDSNKEATSPLQSSSQVQSSPSKPTNSHQIGPQTQNSPPSQPVIHSPPQTAQNNISHTQNQNHSQIVVPIPQPQIQEAHQHNVTQQPPPSMAQDYHEPTSEPAHSSAYQIAHQSSWGQMPHQSSGKNYQNPSGGSSSSTSASNSSSNNNNSTSTINALDIVDCAIHHALGSEGNGNSSNPNPPPPSNQHSHHNSHQQLHGNNPSVLSIVHHQQSEPMELSYKLDSNPNNSFQDMPMELTKVFQRDPLELCVRQDFSNPLMDLSSRVVESGNMGMISGINMNNMNMNGVCGMGMGMTTNSYHKLDLTDRELMDMGAFRQPIDLISRADDGHQLCSEGNLVDLSLRSTFGGQDQSASSFLRELIDLSARSDSFHGGELDLTKHPHQHHHPVTNHHSQHQHHHHSSSAGGSGSGAGGKALNNSSLQHVVYQDAMFSLQN